MDEKSVWKKEISFRRKSKAPKVEARDDGPKSVWKKQISFKRKPKVKTEVVAETKPVTAAKPGTEAKPSIWKREITLGRKKIAQPDPVHDVAVESTEPRDSGPEAETAEVWPPQIETVVPEHIQVPEPVQQVVEPVQETTAAEP